MPLPSRDLLDELYARFILNVPTGELDSEERMMFVIEEAHWFYEVRLLDPHRTFSLLFCCWCLSSRH